MEEEEEDKGDRKGDERRMLSLVSSLERSSRDARFKSVRTLEMGDEDSDVNTLLGSDVILVDVT